MNVYNSKHTLSLPKISFILVLKYNLTVRNDGLFTLGFSGEKAVTVVFLTQGIFVFCLVWSVGASCDDLGRVTFDAVVREVLNGPLSEETRACYGILVTVEAPPKQLTVPLPTEGTVYQYRFIKEVRLRAAERNFALVS